MSWLAYLQGLEGVGVSVAVQDDVVGHAEALSDPQVVEEGELAKGVGHLHHSNVWGGLEEMLGEGDTMAPRLSSERVP